MGEIKKILVVEDELGFAKMVKLRLESVGYSVTIAGDAYTGTQEIFRNDYDLIVLDLMMPAGGGFSLLERTRKIPNKADIPVVIVTGKTVDDEVKRLASEYNVSEIFTKPYNSVEFVDKIKSLLKDA
ncbi:response regulator transcription factor [candidate division KSB1 bacterium]|nr:response regulator transcription factor [candidate division KSB1 bacterium]